MSQIIVIYDGECDFCMHCVRWVQKRLQITALAYQAAPLSDYAITPSQAGEQLHVLSSGVTYKGASAVAYLLKRRGNRFLSWVITSSGPLADFGYNWVAHHRSSFVVVIIKKLLRT